MVNGPRLTANGAHPWPVNCPPAAINRLDKMKIVILGNGIAGTTAARSLRKLGDFDITIVSDEAPHFFSRTALMYVFMGHMKWENIKPYEDFFWGKNRINLIHGRVETVDFENKKLHLTNSESIGYDHLILATGSKSNRFGWPGQDLPGVQGLYFKQDLESMEAAAQKGIRRAVIVGGGLIGIEMAEMFLSRNIPVTFLVREAEFWGNILPKEEAQMIGRHIREHHVDLRFQTELKEILPGENGRAAAVITNLGEKIDCDFVGLTVGVSPNIDFLKNTPLETNRGIVVDEFLRTNQPNVWAIGDCAEIKTPAPGRRPIEAIWYTGRMMGETVARSIAQSGNSGFSIQHSAFKYDPGIWFNSAKFFDIEYQVYGDIRPNLGEGQATVFWKDSDEKRAIRIVFDEKTGKTLGFNLMGIRYRHEVCERWLRDGAHIETVLENLGLANFDPEFFKEYEPELLLIYNKTFGKNLQLRTRRGLSKVLSFLK